MRNRKVRLGTPNSALFTNFLPQRIESREPGRQIELASSSAIGYNRSMSRAIASTLIVALLACPVFCGRGHGSQRVAGSRLAGNNASHGSSCCHHEGSSEHRSGPVDHSPSHQGQSRQCICCGAVFDQAASPQVDFDWSWSLPMAIVGLTALDISALSLVPVAQAPWPDVGMNHGRALCYLLSTMQC